VNRDRRAIVGVLADVAGAYTKERSIPNKVLMVIRDATKGLAETEARSIKKMEGFKDTENTARNYQNAVACHEDLLAAQEALEEGELADALPYLQRVADPEAAARAVAPKPVKKTTSRRK
jgi:hypothetical protein